MASPIASCSTHTLDVEDDLIDHLLILYASETGNAQDTAERVGREVRRRGRRCVVQSMDRYDVMELPHASLVIFITSTHGRGDPPPTMLPLWTTLLRKSLPPDILEGVNFALFGLGDSSYERFAYAGKLLHRRLVALGAEPILEATYGDERAPDGLEQSLVPWLESLIEGVIPHLQPVDGARETDRTELADPIYRVEFLHETELSRIEDLRLDEEEQYKRDDKAAESLVNGHLHGKNGDARNAAGPPLFGGSDKSHQVWKPDDWGWATLWRKDRVTKKDWWQDVREIELELEDEKFNDYLPASIANLQPAMSFEEVEDFLESQGLTDIANRPLRIYSAISDQPLPSHLPPPGHTTTLRILLTNHLDLRCSPRKSFFEWLRRLSGDEREQERLDEFISDPDEIHTYATRPSRSIIETLADFREVRIPMSHILEILPPLRRRQFSIASSWTSHPGKIQLLIAMVEYKTNLQVPRRGLCSSWLQDLPVGSRIPIHIAAPTLHLPADPTTPVILVGPGTGVAPMRAFLEERIRLGAASNTTLYFGCRSTSSDLYYDHEWQDYRKLGTSIRVAASRDGPEKVYVQDLIREDKVRINDWLVNKRGHVYICGSSNAMPKSVREALAWCISSSGVGDLSTEEAEMFVEDMFEQGRGGEESW